MILNGFDSEKGEGLEKRGDYTSTAALATVMQLYLLNYNKAVIHASEVTTFNVDWLIEGTNDYSNFTTLLAQTTIAVGAQGYAIISDAWAAIRIRIIDTVAASHGVITIVASLKP